MPTVLRTLISAASPAAADVRSVTTLSASHAASVRRCARFISSPTAEKTVRVAGGVAHGRLRVGVAHERLQNRERLLVTLSRQVADRAELVGRLSGRGGDLAHVGRGAVVVEPGERAEGHVAPGACGTWSWPRSRAAARRSSLSLPAASTCSSAWAPTSPIARRSSTSSRTCCQRPRPSPAPAVASTYL